MYIKEIYDQWELHPDATQLEIKYKFLTNFVDILDVESLVKTNDLKQQPITDLMTLQRWKKHRIAIILKQFKDISSTAVEKSLDSSILNVAREAFFLAGQILNELKVTNYKASSLEVYYEPKLLQCAKSYLDIDVFEKWVSKLSNRIFLIDETTLLKYTTRRFDWVINYNKDNLKNYFWYLENCLLLFRDIVDWYNSFIKSNAANKNSAINILNHLIIYGLTDFYAKYYTEANNDSFQHVYKNLLIEISLDVHNQTFAFTAFSRIAEFLNQLIISRKISKDDDVVHDFLGVIKISCSLKNYGFFIDLVFKATENITAKTTALNADLHPNDQMLQKTKPLNANPLYNNNIGNERVNPTSQLKTTPLHTPPISGSREDMVTKNDTDKVEQMTIPFFGDQIQNQPEDNEDQKDPFDFTTVPFDTKGEKNE